MTSIILPLLSILVHNIKTLNPNPHIIKIKDGKYGIISLNNMIPIKESLLMDFDIMTDANKNVLVTQFIFCQKNIFKIRERAFKIYQKRTLNPNAFEKKV